MPFDPSKPVDASLVTAAELRAQFNALKALIDAQPVTTFGRVAADWTSSSTSFTDVSGLSFAVAAGESWTAEMVLHISVPGSGPGVKFRVAGPGAGSVLIAILGTGASSSMSIECEVQTAFSVAAPAKTFCQAPGLTGVVRVHVVVTNATAGTVQLQANNTAGSGTVAIKLNSDLVARRTG
ncbi:MAG: hypothetical protein ABIZ56_03075 [Chthoniobacteraceae bacterium]